MSSSRDSIMNSFSMNGGDGKNSYANNSSYQRDILSDTQLVVAENITAMLGELGFPEYIKVADLGCSSGPNTYLAMSGIVNTIIDSYHQKGRTDSPEIDCFLNDLPENDFNTTFKLLPSFQEGLKTDLKEREALDPKYRDSFHMWSVLSDSLLDLVSEGLVKESQVDAFNMPFYDPNEVEMKEVLEREGSFEINKIETREFAVHYASSSEDVVDESSDQFKKWQSIANIIRCISESILVPHFGEAIMDRLFHRYAIHVAKHLTVSTRPTKSTVNIIVSLTRK
ncbi:hypothetical protein AALP_AA1G252900 [Arabis alpina]|uniref:Uncharacterized protein n=1 Tax=Arabis alpina TaxID=50452 RepID=A0A087HQK2_ARAAL|nr:hypothetical protein AALP_AA1G252900 [Arabis alpina]